MNNYRIVKRSKPVRESEYRDGVEYGVQKLAKTWRSLWTRPEWVQVPIYSAFGEELYWSCNIGGAHEKIDRLVFADHKYTVEPIIKD